MINIDDHYLNYITDYPDVHSFVQISVVEFGFEKFSCSSVVVVVVIVVVVVVVTLDLCINVCLKCTHL